jgi:hypothetical protein
MVTTAVQMVISEDTDPESGDWLSLEWSPWLSLDPDDGDLSTLSTEEGLYRVRHPAYDHLVYIGETGRSIRGRVQALARGTYASEMPYRDPHTAAPCLWAINDEHGPDFEVSVATPERATEKQDRKATEEALIALHRREFERSPVANFGRIIPGYRQSGYSSDGFVGGPLPEGETESNSEPGVGPLQWTDWQEPLATEWMGLDWSEPDSLADAYQQVPKQPGVYRIWQPDEPEPLEYIGESKTLRNRLYRHRRNRDGELRFSFAPLSEEFEAAHKRDEIETDLLGAHYLACEQAPRDQF